MSRLACEKTVEKFEYAARDRDPVPEHDAVECGRVGETLLELAEDREELGTLSLEEARCRKPCRIEKCELEQEATPNVTDVSDRLVHPIHQATLAGGRHLVDDARRP